MHQLYEPLSFKRGPVMKNRFMLAPLTNSQSHENGVLSEEEFRWLTMRAEGGFGLTMTCAAHVQEIGKGFPGQLGIFSDEHLAGLSRLAAHINAQDSISIVQLHHAGNRSPADLIGTTPVSASDDPETGARGLSEEEVQQLIEDFVTGAVRAEQAGFHGAEIHGAHGYIVCQFLSQETNRRDDAFGGSMERRWRILFDIIDGIRNRCSDDFMLGLRLSPERFGMQLAEVVEMAQRLCDENHLDFLDMSLWDVFKTPEEEGFKDQPLIKYFTALDRGDTRLGVAGKIRTPEEAAAAMAEGVDWIMLGRAAILHHNFPQLMQSQADFKPAELPVSRDYLANEGLSPKFVDYMAGWPGFVTD